MDSIISDTIISQTIRLLLVDDHAMFREGLARVLEREPDFVVAGQCGSSAEALAVLKGNSAYLVLLDVDLGTERARDFVLDARRKGFSGKILIVTAGVSDQEALRLVQCGVSGILHKHNSAEILCETIRHVARGEVSIEKDYLGTLFRSVDQTRPRDYKALSDRDKIMLRYIFQGFTNRSIGAQLQISEGAVKSALRLLCGKLGVKTRAQLVKVALEQYRDQL